MVRESVNLLELLRRQAAGGDLDFLREAVAVLAEAVMEAEVAEQAGAAYGERSPERITRRNGYRPRRWDTRAGSIELQIPKLRQGSYFPALLEPRRRARHHLPRPGAGCRLRWSGLAHLAHAVGLASPRARRGPVARHAGRRVARGAAAQASLAATAAPRPGRARPSRLAPAQRDRTRLETRPRPGRRLALDHAA